MITLFDATSRHILNITSIDIHPALKWIGGIVCSSVIAWASWATNEIMAARSAALDTQAAITRIDNSYTRIDNRLERIETLLMNLGVSNARK